MKKTSFNFLLLFSFVIITSCSKSGNETLVENNVAPEIKHLNYPIGNGPFVYFEDNVFKDLLLNNFSINSNHDNEITIVEALVYNANIDVSFKHIKSLVGVEKFENLVALNCANNDILHVDFSKNINLEYLDCSVNPFIEIDLTLNSKLKQLQISNTNITDLDLSKNTNLGRVVGQCNHLLKSINVKNDHNTDIGIFYFEMNNTALKCIQVDNLNYSSTNGGWLKPANANYSTNCYDVNHPH